MKVKEIMTKSPEVIGPDAVIAEAARRMARLNVGAIPVCDGAHLIGMITDRDLAIRGTAAGLDPVTSHVREVMSPNVTFCFEDDAVETAARLMEERQIRRLPVLDREKQLVGVVSLGDLAVRSGKTRLSGEVLEQVSHPSRTPRASAVGIPPSGPSMRPPASP